MDRRFTWAVGMLPYVWATVLLTWRPEAKPLPWDTETFVNFAPFRPAGYPIFLKAVEGLTGSLVLVPEIQTWAFAIAVSFLLMSVWFATASKVTTCLTAVIFLLNPVTTFFHLKVLSDSLALTLAVTFMACAFAAHRTPSLWILAAMGTVAGWATAIRPSSVSLLVAGLAFVWVTWPLSKARAASRFLVLVCPFVACAVAEDVAYHRYHAMRQTVSTRHMFAKAMLIPDPPELEGELGVVAKDLHGMYAPVRDLLASMPTYGTRWYMNARYEVTAQWVLYGTPSVRARTGWMGHDAAMAAIAWSSLYQHPLQHLSHAFGNWLALWYVPDLLDPYEGGVIGALASAEPPIPFSGQVDVLPNRPATALAYVIQPFFTAGLVVPLLVLGAALRKGKAVREDPFMTLATLMAVYVVVQSVTVAFVAVAISRYSMGIFPFAWLCCFLLAVSLSRSETRLGSLVRLRRYMPRRTRLA